MEQQQSGMLAVENWPVERVLPYGKNPRKRDRAAVEQVAQSIREFGWRQPIVVDEEGVVIVGHGRLMAAQLLKLREVPVHVARGLSEQQRQAYRIADNRSNELSKWDWTLLRGELSQLREGDALRLSGFSTADLDKIVNSQDRKGTGADILNVTIGEPVASVVVGDVWRLGHHVMVVEEVIEGWPKWVSMLAPGMLLCVYPTPHVTLTDRAREVPCLLVQPDPFIAAHCVDRFTERFGADGVRKLND